MTTEPIMDRFMAAERDYLMAKKQPERPYETRLGA